MHEEIKNIMASKKLRQLADVRNVGLYIFGVIVLAIAWSGAKTVQNNYQLQKQIDDLKQQNAVLSLQNDNAALQNEFYKTDEYLELSARQNLGLASPGEKELIVPKATAMRYVDPSLTDHKSSAVAVMNNSPKYVRNLEDWRDFLLGRKIFGN